MALPIPLPSVVDAELERDIAELSAAIALVANGDARRIVIVGLHHAVEATREVRPEARAAGVRIGRGRRGSGSAIVVERVPTSRREPVGSA